jgi:hypothetical protein
MCYKIRMKTGSHPHDPTTDEGVDDSADRGALRPYAAPRILSREPLEAVAAVCSPAPPAKSNPGLCPSGPISS